MQKFDLKWGREVLAVHVSARSKTTKWFIDEEFESLLKDRIFLDHDTTGYTNQYIFIPSNSDITKEEFRGNSIKVHIHKPYVRFDNDSDAVLYKLSYR